MRRIFSLLVFFILLGTIFVHFPPRVQAETCVCSAWDCKDEPCPERDCPYGGNNQVCECKDSAYNCNPDDPVVCGPDSYVCNRDGEQCCPNGDPPGDGDGGDGSTCGDGICGNLSWEDCQTCESDCGACPVVSVDIKADGSDTNIVTTRPYNISWDSVNSYENSCLLNGSQVT